MNEIKEIIDDSYHNWKTSSILWNKLKHQARENRKKLTEAEKKLWNELRAHKLNGLKFRRQHTIAKFIVDFYCNEKKLIIEVDGEIHDYQKVKDMDRQKFLEETGYKVLRFKNKDVLDRIEEVKNKILKWCNV